MRLLLLAALIALLPLAAWWWRHRGDGPVARQRALALLVAFLTFDLIVFGAFTRLTDSGLGCPDWPGCYGHASPVGAAEPIQAAQQAMPSGPVTATKAWIEMLHRYLAMTVGALIVALVVLGWRARKALPMSFAWPLAALAWVIVQGLFGKYTVTLKLQPAIVTLHLLGGLLLLALLVRQAAGLHGGGHAAAGVARCCGAGAGPHVRASGARWLGQQQLRCAGVQRLPGLQRAMVAGHGLVARVRADARTGPCGRWRATCRFPRWWRSTGRIAPARWCSRRRSSGWA